MPKYNDSFNLNVEDIELIEQALRAEIGNILRPVDSDDIGFSSPCPEKVQKMNGLLGKIHNQKIFYSVANPGGVPLG
ncbi:MAG: hypothetical protein GKR95_17700 [Gammaproteobacteria bacterium]|nr:hypothetical protein [Gammaproteobacteria bacterium]